MSRFSRRRLFGLLAAVPVVAPLTVKAVVDASRVALAEEPASIIPGWITLSHDGTGFRPSIPAGAWRRINQGIAP